MMLNPSNLQSFGYCSAENDIVTKTLKVLCSLVLIGYLTFTHGHPLRVPLTHSKAELVMLLLLHSGRSAMTCETQGYEEYK